MKRKPKKESKKRGSLSFFVAIPASYLFGIVGLFALAVIVARENYNEPAWLWFALGIMVSLSTLRFALFSFLRTFIHELKHALLVVLTGNKLKDFRVRKKEGHVEYDIFSDRLHYAPVITLAPYFLPLCSFPVLLAALVIDIREWREILAFILGACLAIDMETALYDLHSKQTDFGAIVGGFLIAGSFIGGVWLLWISLCLLWVAEGRSAYAVWGAMLFEIGEQLLALLRSKQGRS